MSELPFRYYLVTDRKKCAPQSLPEAVEEACSYGIKAVQLREKDLSGRELYNLAQELREITRKHNTKLFINDRADIAMSVQADGVHCRESSMLPADVKRLDSDFIIGASIHSIESALKAEDSGADFVLFGPIFFTPSKADYGSPQGIEKLKEVVHSISIPVYAIGGITPQRGMQCLEDGAYGVAGISSIMMADSISRKVEEWETMLGDL